MLALGGGRAAVISYVCGEGEGKEGICPSPRGGLNEFFDIFTIHPSLRPPFPSLSSPPSLHPLPTISLTIDRSTPLTGGLSRRLVLGVGWWSWEERGERSADDDRTRRLVYGLLYGPPPLPHRPPAPCAYMCVDTLRVPLVCVRTAVSTGARGWMGGQGRRELNRLCVIVVRAIDWYGCYERGERARRGSSWSSSCWWRLIHLIL